MYAGLAILFFYLTIYLQQVAGYSALQSGLDDGARDDRDVRALAPLRRARRSLRAAALHGRRAARSPPPGILPLARAGRARLVPHRACSPALLVFALGLSITVAPLTATVLADADEDDAGIASAVNNAVARVASLIGVSVVGIVVAGTLVGDTFAGQQRVRPGVPPGDRDLRGTPRRRRPHRRARDRQPAPARQRPGLRGRSSWSERPSPQRRRAAPPPSEPASCPRPEFGPISPFASAESGRARPARMEARMASGV